ncbi:MAG: hypothetical protein GWN31_16060, partial [Candidatus Thorarchaeota archaeon]|nr:hypothetical protein [Candidatus Thorarchaeota archaeon]
MNVDKRTAKTEWIDYSGTIHCVEVKNNIIYVRKNGIPVFSGNSIIPENEAPRTKDGTPADILLNPHGIITRINIGQVLENAASKVAEKTGKTYVTDNFSDKNSTQEVKDALAKNNLSDLEELEDPVTGKSLGKVNVGKTYIMKLKKQVRSQFSARGAGPGWRYSQHTQEPVKGGEEG